MDILKINSRLYPANLKEILNPPQALWVLGKILKKDSKAIAIVGSRKASERGKKIAFEFACLLSKRGFTIVSGLARGIDTVAHKAALLMKGRTIAVLGSGLNNIYPFENKDLAKTISREGALVSEFSPNTPAFPKNFLQRNRIVSGLAKAVLVVEGGARSGTLSTVSYAANQGRDVLAIPGSPATNWLIREGALVVKTPSDVLDYLSSLV